MSQFFAEIPEHLEDKGYYNWVSVRIKKNNIILYLFFYFCT